MMGTTPTNQPELLTIDCRGLRCPAPILRIAEVARQHKNNPIVFEVLANDGDFPTDLDAWCRTTKSKVVEISKTDDGSFRAQVAMANATPPPPQSVLRKKIPSQEGKLSEQVTPPSDRVSIPPLDLSGQSVVQVMRFVAEKTLQSNETLVVTSDAPGIEKRLLAWAIAMEAQVSVRSRSQDKITFVISTGQSGAVQAPPSIDSLASTPPTTSISKVPDAPTLKLAKEDRCTFLVFKNDVETLMAALMVANASAAQGIPSEIFFAFWGINLLRGESPRKNTKLQKISWIHRLFRWLMPKGPRRQPLSKMNYGGIGKRMFEFIMRKQNILTLDKLVDAAVAQNVTFTVCSMSMGMMGIQEADIMDLPNVRFAGVTSFAELARRSSFSLTF